MKRLFFLLIINFFVTSLLYSQLEIEEYKKFKEDNKNMTVEELLKMYPAGVFNDKAPADIINSEYGDSVVTAFNLSSYEKDLITHHGFMTTERVSYPTFIHAYTDIFRKDLPVFISSDAILHAMHFSFNKILQNTELEFYYILSDALKLMKDSISAYDIADAPDLYQTALKDLDLYLTIAQRLIVDDVTCYFPENESHFDEIYNLIMAANGVSTVFLFSDNGRIYDFSQFTPRGHYTASIELIKYFRAMTWLGRTEFVLKNAENAQMEHNEISLQRMAIASAMLTELVYKSGASSHFERIESILALLLGEQDNINFKQIKQVLNENQLTSYDLLNTAQLNVFLDKLMSFATSQQSYASQVLVSDNSTESIVPPTVFLLMGQRPILDGFITANVVYDRVIFNNQKIKRMVPSTQDILFSLGNNASTQLLFNELDKYHYASNLAGLRYLVDSFDDSFWNKNSYSIWLNAIRSLNPPKDRRNLPLFMQTAAWWQKTINTQLAGWAQLRYNFLLYGKQPYTSSFMCSYPHGIVEPVPDFYQNIKRFFTTLNSEFGKHSIYIEPNFIINWINVTDSLTILADKLLIKEPYNEDDIRFMNRMVKISGGICSGYEITAGWYHDLYYGIDIQQYMLGYENIPILEGDKFIVADVHTIPMDESQNMVGWVLHCGTGDINLTVITTDAQESVPRTYCGAVFSYYEFISNDFQRLTVDEWRNKDLTYSMRPNLTGLYLADKEGNQPAINPNNLLMVQTSVSDNFVPTNKTKMLDCFPNPAKNTISFNFTIQEFHSSVKLEVFDIRANRVATLIDGNIDNNNYLYVWDLTDSNKNRLSSGTYIVKLQIGNSISTEKIIIE